MSVLIMTYEHPETGQRLEVNYDINSALQGEVEGKYTVLMTKEALEMILKRAGFN